jgi:hypothetical protein
VSVDSKFKKSIFRGFFQENSIWMDFDRNIGGVPQSPLDPLVAADPLIA